MLAESTQQGTMEEQIGVKEDGSSQEWHVPTAEVGSADCRIECSRVGASRFLDQRNRVVQMASIPSLKSVLNPIDPPVEIAFDQLPGFD